MTRIRRLVAPAEAVVSLAEAKAHLRVEHADEDAYIQSLVNAATSHLDGWSGTLGRALVEQTWEVTLDAFPVGAIHLPLGDVIAVVSVVYDDTAGDEQTVPPTDYVLDNRSLDGWVVPVSGVSWPDTLDAVNAVRVRYTAGYGAASAVPAAIKHAILMLVAHWYANREAVNVGNIITAFPMAVDALTHPFRVLRV
jgi:uncharacterized phiE125 gp8 family phage protein